VPYLASLASLAMVEYHCTSEKLTGLANQAMGSKRNSESRAGFGLLQLCGTGVLANK
jgi:hypothetical protein